MDDIDESERAKVSIVPKKRKMLKACKKVLKIKVIKAKTDILFSRAFSKQHKELLDNSD